MARAKKGTLRRSRVAAPPSIARLRTVRIRIPDTASPAFAAECRRQSLLVATDPQEREIMSALGSALGPIPDWKA